MYEYSEFKRKVNNLVHSVILTIHQDNCMTDHQTCCYMNLHSDKPTLLNRSRWRLKQASTHYRHFSRNIDSNALTVFTMNSRVIAGTLTRVGIYLICAIPFILTWIWRTFIYVCNKNFNEYHRSFYTYNSVETSKWKSFHTFLANKLQRWRAYISSKLFLSGHQSHTTVSCTRFQPIPVRVIDWRKNNTPKENAVIQRETYMYRLQLLPGEESVHWNRLRQLSHSSRVKLKSHPQSSALRLINPIQWSAK